MYEELKQLRYCEIHCNVSYGFSENTSIGKWVYNQIKKYKCTNQGKSSSINDPRIKLLEDIGFMWSIYANKKYWIEKYEELKQFKCCDWYCNIPFRFSEK